MKKNISYESPMMEIMEEILIGSLCALSAGGESFVDNGGDDFIIFEN